MKYLQVPFSDEKSVQLVRVASFRSDFFKNPYFRNTSSINASPNCGSELPRLRYPRQQIMYYSTMYKKSENKKTVAATALLQQYFGLKKKRFAVSAQHVSVRAVALAELMRF